MPYFIATVLIQILCVIHIIKSGNNKLWLTAIIFLPLAGCIAYFLMEILPGMQGNRHVRYAKKKAIAKIDPEKDLRLARERLEITDSLANRISLADALAEQRNFAEAVKHYREIVASPQGWDERIGFKYASALFENGDFANALIEIEKLPEAAVNTDENRRSLLKARILEHLGRNEEAAEIFENIVEKMAGIEPRCHYAALLLKMGRKGPAQVQLEEVVRKTRHMDRTQIGDDQPILEWAKAELKALSD